METSAHIERTIEHLFRREWGKLVSVLTKLFGPQNLHLAEDVVQDTLLKALSNWKINGLPENPSAWLFTAARNKAIDVLRQQKRQHEFSKNISPLLGSEYSLVPTVADMVNSNSIDDDQLRMMFVCCHPSLSTDAQVSLILKTLCGFSVSEIARAFIVNYDTIEKRLYRARQNFRDSNVQFDFPAHAELEQRMENVLTAIYLLFNEGYNSTSHDELIRNDLMEEAMRLCEIICRNPLVKSSHADALMSLMCFTASRNRARQDDAGNILLMKEQDRAKWNRTLIEKGTFFLEKSAEGEGFGKYHLEAGIAFEHARAGSYANTIWKNIVGYYDLLLAINPSPVIALNRAIAISELNGAAEGIRAVENIDGIETLKKFYLLPATLGEFHFRLGDKEKARQYFEEAMKLTQSPAEKNLLRLKILALA